VTDPDPEPDRADLLQVERRRVGDAHVVTVAGEVDPATVDVLRGAVAEALDDPETGAVVVDLTAVSFLGSAGLKALVDARAGASHRNEPLRLVVDSARPVTRPLEVSGLDQVLATFEDLESALAGTVDRP
jgi:anti-sigma B factor antagonist